MLLALAVLLVRVAPYGQVPTRWGAFAEASAAASRLVHTDAPFFATAQTVTAPVTIGLLALGIRTAPQTVPQGWSVLVVVLGSLVGVQLLRRQRALRLQRRVPGVLALSWAVLAPIPDAPALGILALALGVLGLLQAFYEEATPSATQIFLAGGLAGLAALLGSSGLVVVVLGFGALVLFGQSTVGAALAYLSGAAVVGLGGLAVFGGGAVHFHWLWVEWQLPPWAPGGEFHVLPTVLQWAFPLLLVLVWVLSPRRFISRQQRRTEGVFLVWLLVGLLALPVLPGPHRWVILAVPVAFFVGHSLQARTRWVQIAGLVVLVAPVVLEGWALRQAEPPPWANRLELGRWWQAQQPPPQFPTAAVAARLGAAIGPQAGVWVCGDAPHLYAALGRTPATRWLNHPIFRSSAMAEGAYRQDALPELYRALQEDKPPAVVDVSGDFSRLKQRLPVLLGPYRKITSAGVPLYVGQPGPPPPAGAR